MSKCTIAVQAFNKADSILATLDSLAACRNASEYALLILQDGRTGSKQALHNMAAHTETRESIDGWLANNSGVFASARFIAEERNYGTCAAAKLIIDKAMERTGAVIFSEDDVVFEADALDWFRHCIHHPAFLRDDVWAIAGESKFFDAKSHNPTAAYVAEAVRTAKQMGLIGSFFYTEFLPSSCFATIACKWNEFGATRGNPNGDRDVNLRCRAEGKLCLWPIVARCRDVGMLHPFGYSVQLRGMNHGAAKNTYVTSDMIGGFSSVSELIEGKGSLYEEFTGRWK